MAAAKKPLTKKEGIKRAPVVSSNLKSVGHDGKKTLEVEFKNGKVYQLYPVTASEHGELLIADSKGKYFYNNIKTKEGIKSLQI